MVSWLRDKAGLQAGHSALRGDTPTGAPPQSRAWACCTDLPGGKRSGLGRGHLLHRLPTLHMPGKRSSATFLDYKPERANSGLTSPGTDP